MVKRKGKNVVSVCARTTYVNIYIHAVYIRVYIYIFTHMYIQNDSTNVQHVLFREAFEYCQRFQKFTLFQIRRHTFSFTQYLCFYHFHTFRYTGLALLY